MSLKEIVMAAAFAAMAATTADANPTWPGDPYDPRDYLAIVAFHDPGDGSGPATLPGWGMPGKGETEKCSGSISCTGGSGGTSCTGSISCTFSILPGVTNAVTSPTYPDNQVPPSIVYNVQKDIYGYNGRPAGAPQPSPRGG